MKGCSRCRQRLPWNGGTLIGQGEYCRGCTVTVRALAREERRALESMGQQSIGELVELPVEGSEQGSLFG